MERPIDEVWSRPIGKVWSRPINEVIDFYHSKDSVAALTAATVRRSNTRQQYLQAFALPYLF